MINDEVETYDLILQWQDSTGDEHYKGLVLKQETDDEGDDQDDSNGTNNGNDEEDDNHNPQLALFWIDSDMDLL